MNVVGHLHVQNRCQSSPVELYNVTIHGDLTMLLTQSSCICSLWLIFPFFEMSLDYSFNNHHPKLIRYHYELGKKLCALRDRGVLIIGSGNLVHNLRFIDFSDVDAVPFDWAVEVDKRMQSHLINGEYLELMEYPYKGEWASRAIPTFDHYLPMIYILGLQEEGEELGSFTRGFRMDLSQ